MSPRQRDVFLFADSSPSLTGLKMFSVPIDVFVQQGDTTLLERRLLPLVSLSRDFLDAVGKLVALLWALWLMLGPQMDQFRHFLGRTRAIVSDCGTERKLADHMDIIPFFYQVLNPKLPESPFSSHTFMRALPIPGWMHTWDNILRRGLASLTFFPKFIDNLRALVSFLRTDILKRQAIKDAKAFGFVMLAELLEDLSLPSLACHRMESAGSLR